MNLEQIQTKIDRYLHSEKTAPLLIDLKSRESIAELRSHFETESNHLYSAGSFCNKDGIIKLDELYDAIDNKWQGNCFLFGLSAFLKIQGEKKLKQVLKALLNKSVPNGHFIIITYQCGKYYDCLDPRVKESGRTAAETKTADTDPVIHLVAGDLEPAFPNACQGLNNIGEAYENKTSQTVYVISDCDEALFSDSLLRVIKLNNAYEALCQRDFLTKTLPESAGSEEQWRQALRWIGESGDWNSVINAQFGSAKSLESAIQNYCSFSEQKKWLYFVANLLLDNSNRYISLSVADALAKGNDFVKSLFRTILNYRKDDKDFEELYHLRKDILRHFLSETVQIDDYCKVVDIKGKDAIYYLTDLTIQEKEKIISWLDTYGQEYSYAQLKDILKNVYPDLYYYLSAYKTPYDSIDDYFKLYKYHKLINKNSLELEERVNAFAAKDSFTRMLQPRSVYVDRLQVDENTYLYFVDALGIEYLSFIYEKIHQFSLNMKVNIGRCSLPSLTCFNKEFVDVLSARKCKVFDEKRLDEIKHHGENNYNYEKVKTPLYLIKELEIISELVNKIHSDIQNGNCKKALIISDHGASRLAVLHDTTILAMQSKGIHSGRCCPKNDVDFKPANAIEANDHWVLSNYDRFKGGRKANVEVHGGALLEEIAVPIIEITQDLEKVEAFILDESKLITIGFGEKPVVKVYVSTTSGNVVARVGEMYCTPSKTAGNVYSFEFKDITAKGDYFMDLLIDSQTVATGLKFTVKKKGMTENSLF